jgi:hypothetical protein
MSGLIAEHTLRWRMHTDKVKPSVLRQGREYAEAIIRRKYSEYPFHSWWHTDNVVRRVREILDSLPSTRLTRYADLGELAAAFHDVERDFKPPLNERISAAHGVLWMRTCTEEGKERFSDQDMSIVWDAIMATVPKGRTYDFEQPYLIQEHWEPDKFTRESRTVATALALADVAVTGLEGFGAYKEDGNRRFHERALLCGREASSQESQDDPTASIRDSLREQVEFAENLPSYFERVLGLVEGEECRNRMRSLFPKFQEANDGSKERLERGQGMDLCGLEREMEWRMHDA